MYGPSSTSSSHNLLPTPHNVPSISKDVRGYSISPVMSAASMSGTASPPATLGQDMMGLSMTSPMVHPALAAYSDPTALSEQPYSMVLQHGAHSNQQSTSETSGYASSRSLLSSSYPSLNMSGSMQQQQTSQAGLHGTNSGQQVSSVQLYHQSYYPRH